MNKPTWATVSAILLLTGSVMAMPPEGRGGPPQGRRGPPPIAEDLGLSGEAGQAFEALTERQHLALFRLHREQLRAERALHTQFEQELAKILSAEQLATFKSRRSVRGPAKACQWPESGRE